MLTELGLCVLVKRILCTFGIVLDLRHSMFGQEGIYNGLESAWVGMVCLKSVWFIRKELVTVWAYRVPQRGIQITALRRLWRGLQLVITGSPVLSISEDAHPVLALLVWQSVQA